MVATTGDVAARIAADARFHGEICRASRNATLLALWQSLGRQLVVVWAVTVPERDGAAAAAEHAAIAAALEAGDVAAAIGALRQHLAQQKTFDVEAALRRRRARLGPAQPAERPASAASA